jgi:hypothetical protein
LRESVLENAFVSLNMESPAALDYWLQTNPTHAASEIALSVREEE